MRINRKRHIGLFVCYFFRRSEEYYYLWTSVYLNAPAVYVLLKMCIFKVIHFIFETSKTVERKKEQNYLLRCKQKFKTNKIFNLFKVTKIICIFRFKKNLSGLNFFMQSLDPIFFNNLLSSCLAFSSSPLALFSYSRLR